VSLGTTSSGWQFLAACREPERHQRALLRALIGRHATTDFGREHGLSPRMSPADYRAAVPVRAHAALSPWIARAVAGEPAVLTRDPPRWFARSSGTTGTPKYLPLTRDGVRAFQTVRDLWLHRTLELYPAVQRGRLFAIASRADEEPLAGGVTAVRQSSMTWVPPGAPLASQVTVATPGPAGSDPEQWQRELLTQALRCDLSVMGATSPSSLVVLLEGLARWGPRLAGELRDDGAGAARAAALGAACGAGLPTARAVWPNLALLACWTEGPSARYAARLATLSGGVPVRDVGLVASEGYFAVPVEREGGAILAAGSYVIELIEASDSTGDPVPWSEVEEGQQLRLVVTTPSGLWRYDTEDVVEVVGRLDRTPAVAFRRRAGQVVSIAGEKVTEQQVVEAVRQAEAVTAVGLVDFLCRLAWPPGGAPRYRFEVELSDPRALPAGFADALDRALAVLNGEYDMRRQAGRLAPVEVVRAAPGMLQTRHGALLAAGVPAAEAKPGHLIIDLPEPSSSPEE